MSLPWILGDSATNTHVLSETAVVTAFCLSSDHIVVALEDGTIQGFNSSGAHQMFDVNKSKPAWALDIRDDTLVSGDTAGDLQVWSHATG